MVYLSAIIWHGIAEVNRLIEFEEPKMKMVKNDDKEFVRGLKKMLKANNGFCPNQPERTPDTKCPCKLYRENNECLCGMYIKIPVFEEE